MVGLEGRGDSFSSGEATGVVTERGGLGGSGGSTIASRYVRGTTLAIPCEQGSQLGGGFVGRGVGDRHAVMAPLKCLKATAEVFPNFGQEQDGGVFRNSNSREQQPAEEAERV